MATLARTAGLKKAARPKKYKTAKLAHAGIHSMVPDLRMDHPSTTPDIIEFLCSDAYLDRGQTLYPRQATLLKVMFCSRDLLTEYDYDVLGEWAEGFRLPEPGEVAAPSAEEGSNWFRYQPSGALARGIQPDWEQRMDICISEGRPWFREVQTIIGRRGSKGFIGGIAGARVLYQYLLKGDPQGHYGIDRDKKLIGIVFAGKRQQAKDNQWRDIVTTILGAPGFQPYIARSLSESLTLYSPFDRKREDEMVKAGTISEMDFSTFEIVPKESTLMAGRGPTSFMQFYDEMAHVVATGANRSAEEVYDAATPSLDQFGVDGFIYAGSSPWQMTGKLYENYQHALSVDPVTRLPMRPEMLMAQLASWDLYEDWQYAKTLAMVPGDHKATFKVDAGREAREVTKVSSMAGVKFNPLKRAHQVYDEQMKRLERSNPDTFKVERLSQWAASLNSYLDHSKIEAMFGEFPIGSGHKLEMQTQGKLSIVYSAHGDPSKSGDSFGWAMGHRMGPDENGLYHVVFDQLHAWHPSDYDDNIIDYIAVEKDIIERAAAFMPAEITFDQFNSVGIIQRIRRALAGKRLPKQIQVEERTATAKLNWSMFETFKTALNMGLIHAPYHELLELELRFLQLVGGRVDHPSAGPVQTKDVADAAVNVVFHLIGEQMGAFMKGDLANLPLSGSQAGGEAPSDETVFSSLSRLSAGGGRTSPMPGMMPPRR